MGTKLRGEFARQVQRAAAQRGALEDVYQDLSDHLTLILQRLYPVWALAGPGLADPGHIEIHSRTIYLDSDRLLGPRPDLLAGRLERWRVLVTLGVALHETMQAKHTKRWVVEHDAACPDTVLVADRRLLEEPRMEAHGCRDHPPRSLRGRFQRRALRAAVLDVILPAFAEQVAAQAVAGRPVSRDLCGRALTYLHARTHYDVLDLAALSALRPVWEAVLGAERLRALDALYARVIWIPDGDNDALTAAAREYRAIIGPPEPDDAEAGDARASGAAGSGAGRGESSAPADGAGDGDGSRATDGEGPPSDSDAAQGVGDAAGDRPALAAGSLRDALHRALDAARDRALQQLDEEVDLADVLARAATTTPADARGRGSGTGALTGRIPDRGVDRPPFPDERAQAERYADRLAKARAVGTRLVDKRTPGGRFDPRALARAQAQRRHGAPVTSRPWGVTLHRRAPLEEPHVGLVIDTSGSMAAFEAALGPIAWILQAGLRRFGGRCAIALFGDAAALLTDGATPLRQVPGIRTGGGTAFAADAIALLCEQLDMDNPRRPRFVYILSDGGWYDTATGVRKIRWLAERGVPTIHLAIGSPPLSVEADRITVIADPAEALDLIAQDTVAALRASHRPAVA